jgi:hypothetical protein
LTPCAGPGRGVFAALPPPRLVVSTLIILELVVSILTMRMHTAWPAPCCSAARAGRVTRSARNRLECK